MHQRLPEVGELYWVDAFLFLGDPERDRPVVVVEAPRDHLDRVSVITRTHDTSVKGVLHPADPKNGCNKPGVFALKNHHRLELSDFVENSELAGQLTEPYLSQVLHLWTM